MFRFRIILYSIALAASVFLLVKILTHRADGNDEFAWRLPKPPDDQKILSSHMTISRFGGRDNSLETGLFDFAIDRYLKYDGYENQGRGLRSTLTLDASLLTPEEREELSSLREGDFVLLCWNEFESDESGERRVYDTLMVLKKLTAREVREWESGKIAESLH